MSRQNELMIDQPDSAADTLLYQPDITREELMSALINALRRISDLQLTTMKLESRIAVLESAGEE